MRPVGVCATNNKNMLYLLQLIKLLSGKDTRYIEKSRLNHLFSAIRQLWTAMSILVLAISVGTIGYRLIEGIPWFDAYYMSLVTLSTVGFGEVVPLSHTGRVFTSFLIIFNIGFFAYAISTITTIFTDVEIHAFFQEFKMMQRIKKLKQHTIVCGFGRHALEVCQELTKQQMPFIVIEKDEAKLAELRNDMPYIFLSGDATDDDILMEAGIERASSLITTLPLDANNLFVVISARQINPKLKIISRLNHAEDGGKLRRAGADHVVMPEKIGGFYMATLVNKPDLVEFFSLISNMGNSRVVFEKIPVSKLKHPFQGISIAESGIVEQTQIPIIGIRFPNGQYQLNPKPDVILHPDMHLVVLGDAEQMAYFSEVALG